MGSNRSGRRRTERLKKAKKMGERLAKKATTAPGTTSPAKAATNP